MPCLVLSCPGKLLYSESCSQLTSAQLWTIQLSRTVEELSGPSGWLLLLCGRPKWQGKVSIKKFKSIFLRVIQGTGQSMGHCSACLMQCPSSLGAPCWIIYLLKFFNRLFGISHFDLLNHENIPTGFQYLYSTKYVSCWFQLTCCLQNLPKGLLPMVCYHQNSSWPERSKKIPPWREVDKIKGENVELSMKTISVKERQGV